MGTVQNPRLSKKESPAEMAGSQTAGREHVPEGKVRRGTSLRSDGLRGQM